MTNQGDLVNIPEEAIEKAARVIYELDPWEDGSSVTAPPFAWRDLSEEDQRNYYPVARAALSAAAPHLMAMAWEEGMNLAWDLAADTEPRPGHVWRIDWMNRMEHEVERNPYRKEQS